MDVADCTEHLLFMLLTFVPERAVRAVYGFTTEERTSLLDREQTLDILKCFKLVSPLKILVRENFIQTRQ